MPEIITGQLTSVVNILSAAAGLGTAAMGLVDASKAFAGGPSNLGFSVIAKAVQPFIVRTEGTPTAFGRTQVLQTLKANWINGVAKADQKAKAKALIHLELTRGNAERLAAAAGVDGAKLASLAEKTAAGKDPDQDEIKVLAQFDVVVSAVLDNAYERADQRYRNGAKLLATVVSTILGIVGGGFVYGGTLHSYLGSSGFFLSALVGLCATPLAPVAKDLTTALQAAVTAASAVKR